MIILCSVGLVLLLIIFSFPNWSNPSYFRSLPHFPDHSADVPSAQVRPEGACALPKDPHGEREDSRGLRFGLAPNARLEHSLPESLASPTADIAIQVQLRATAANGVIMFASGERHQEFSVLYLVEGKPAFAFGNAQAKVMVGRANRSIDRETMAQIYYLIGNWDRNGK